MSEIEIQSVSYLRSLAGVQPEDSPSGICLIWAADEIERLHDDMETAWGIIANAYGGDWEKAIPEWGKAAERWRDLAWHRIVGKFVDDRPEVG